MNDEWLYKQFMLYSHHGQSKDAYTKTQKGAWEYDIICPGYKCNMTDLLAGIGLAQLRRFETFLDKRKKLIEMYDRLLRPIGYHSMEHYGDNYSSAGHLYLLRIPGVREHERNEVIEKMSEAGIAANVHYKPLPMLTAYRRMGFDINDYPNAYAQYENEITLPLHTKLSDEDVEYICKNLTKAVSALQNNKRIKAQVV